jgi:uncharacterized membrane protein YGL010W
VIHYPSTWPESGPAGRGGWLLFVAAGLVYTVLSLPFTLLQGWLPWLLDPATWAELADPTAHDLHPSWPAFVVFYLLVTVLLGFAATVGLILFARRSPEFPKYMIAYYFGSFVFLWALVAVEHAMFQTDSSAQSQTPIDALIALLWMLAGVPYIVRSRRVKNTFTKGAAPAAASPNPAA